MVKGDNLLISFFRKNLSGGIDEESDSWKKQQISVRNIVFPENIKKVTKIIRVSSF